ncbi:uncharacterized protein BDZ99DRAFT_212107 [Mytilinidion resinicola]|uniref:Uncharacterized protein n=1 Tax=Mytilinidion resinicola TaxID=574789 RepID=A0A6A6Y004_9PEZI|nr:uncharacterized protein BDZ99DRAFT_212107 [Mytilinidion resinicola]KAF2801980.1 hypothetical protein BDZ99DRAFT_212107 [Mytilinidion resinicola]
MTKAHHLERSANSLRRHRQRCPYVCISIRYGRRSNIFGSQDLEGGFALYITSMFTVQFLIINLYTLVYYCLKHLETFTNLLKMGPHHAEQSVPSPRHLGRHYPRVRKSSH